MTLQLRCSENSGSVKVKVVDLPEAKTLRVRCRDKDGLEVLMVFKRAANRRCELLCSGEGKAFLEGMIVEEADLDVGAVVEVGKQRFEIADPTGDIPSPRLVKNKEHLDLPCSHCGTPFGADDCTNAWVDGKFRICVACLGKGVRPQHLSDWRYSLEVDVDDPIEAAAQETEAYQRPQPLASRSSSSDIIPIGGSEPRSRRRISASSSASIPAVDPSEEGQKSIIGKVTRVFRRRSSEDGSLDRDRLSELEEQRRNVLLEAGRLSLTKSGGMGLPADLLATLDDGKTVSFSESACDTTALADWRSRQRQLAHLDAEISALRNALGMPSDPNAPVANVTLRTEQDALEDRAFQASDGMLTEDLGGLASGPLAPDTEAYGANDSLGKPEPLERKKVESADPQPSREPARGGAAQRRGGQRRRRR